MSSWGCVPACDACLYEGVVREGDMVFLENCRMNGKREMIVLQMAGLMGSEGEETSQSDLYVKPNPFIAAVIGSP